MLPTNSVISESGSIYGLTQLGLGSYPSRSVIPEAVATTFSLLKTDEPVFSTASVRPAVPCQPTSAVAGPIFSNVRYPHPTFPGGIHHFHGRFYPGVGRPYGGFSNFRYPDPSGSPAQYQLFGAQGGSFGPKPLGFSALGSPGFVVDLFMWLQAQDIVLRARHIPGCLNVIIADRLSRPNQLILTEWSLNSEIVISQFWGTPKVDMFAGVHNTRLLQFMIQFRSLKHWRWMLCLRTDSVDQCTCFRHFLCSTRSPRQQK